MRTISSLALLAIVTASVGSLLYGCSTLDAIGCTVGITTLCATPTATPTPASPPAPSAKVE